MRGVGRAGSRVYHLCGGPQSHWTVVNSFAPDWNWPAPTTPRRAETPWRGRRGVPTHREALDRGASRVPNCGRDQTCRPLSGPPPSPSPSLQTQILSERGGDRGGWYPSFVSGVSDSLNDSSVLISQHLRSKLGLRLRFRVQGR